MRILQVNSLLTGGGTDDQCLRLAHGLAKLGQDVWLSAPSGRELSGLVGALGIRHCEAPARGALKLDFIRATARHCRAHRIQILHGHHGRDLWPTILAARWSGVRPKVVLTRHLAKSPSSFLSRRLLLGQVDALLAVSEFVARVLREGVDEPDSPVEERHRRPPLIGDLSKIRVAQGGIDPERFHPFDASVQRAEWGLCPGDVAFGVVGGYDFPRGKGQREFLQAASRIRAAAPAARFLVIGRGSMKSTLEGDIAALGLQGRAWLTPYCGNMPAAMNALDCLVHPQVATDAFPTVILEAMACNKPVIATACDGAPEQFENGGQGLLVPMEDVGALAKAMCEIAGNAALRSRLGGAGRERVLGRFTLDHMAVRVLRVYQDLMTVDRR
ncbi:MAG: glycosyltransferase family 4 protein [Verrucomicrobiales bacterium]|nr:glycosyltransferase family 4 protein [Verrucomicrobiales bacterium]